MIKKKKRLSLMMRPCYIDILVDFNEKSYDSSDIHPRILRHKGLFG